MGLDPEAGKWGRSWKVTGRKWGWNRKRVRGGEVLEGYRKEVGLEPEAGEGKGGRSWKVTGRKWGWNRKRVRGGGSGRLQEGSGAGTGSG